MRRHESRDDRFDRFNDLQPARPGDPCVFADNRLFLNAVLRMAKTDAGWRDLPERLGKWNSVARRLSR